MIFLFIILQAFVGEFGKVCELKIKNFQESCGLKTDLESFNNFLFEREMEFKEKAVHSEEHVKLINDKKNIEGRKASWNRLEPQCFRVSAWIKI